MASSMHSEAVRIRCGAVEVEGMLDLPPDPAGVVLFAHGSGSSRFSPRNNFVAAALQQSRIGTLLMDLLTQEEDENDRTRFDIALLTQRLAAAVDALRQFEHTTTLPLGLFGASTGAAAALEVAAQRPDDIAALVSRGGRPDMARAASLGQVRAPTLLIVGGLDATVIDLNRGALALLTCEKQMEIVPDAGHLFEEPGKLATVAAMASKWFLSHLPRPDTDTHAPVQKPASRTPEKRAT